MIRAFFKVEIIQRHAETMQKNGYNDTAMPGIMGRSAFRWHIDGSPNVQKRKSVFMRFYVLVFIIMLMGLVPFLQQ